jgi:xylose dehydrogenase (NAD/NADP)
MDLEACVDSIAEREWQTETSGTVRLAVIGLGWWTVEEAIPAVENVEACRVTVAVSGSQEKATAVVEDHHQLERGLTYDEFHDGAASQLYDAVYICSPNALHLPYAETAASLGKAVLCEKPLEASVERASRLVDACANIPLMVGYRMQTAPVVRHAREMIRAGAIGDPVHVLGNNSQSLLELIDDPDQWRLDPSLVGEGASVTDIGIYPLNTARFLLDSDPVRAQATMSSTSDAFAAVPDERAGFLLTFDDETIVVCTASQNAHASTSLRVIGTEGELHIEPAFHMETKLRVTRGGTESHYTFPETNQMEELFAYFANRVLTSDPIGPNGEHGLHDMRTIEAIYEAAADSAAVPIDTPSVDQAN